MPLLYHYLQNTKSPLFKCLAFTWNVSALCLFVCACVCACVCVCVCQCVGVCVREREREMDMNMGVEDKGILGELGIRLECYIRVLCSLCCFCQE